MAQQTSPWILDATSENFQRDAVERSRELTVVVDFWAEWCQPCRTLGPVLEKLAVELDGKFLLVKAETEKLPDIAAGFGVQSIPAVYAMRDGQLIDYFVGALPEPQIRAWLERILPSPAEELLAQANAVAASDPAEAEKKFREAAALDPKLTPAQIGLASLLFDLGRIEESLAIVNELERRGFLEPEAERLKSQLTLREQGQQAGSLDDVRKAAQARPDDLAVQLNLAEALAAAGQYEEALQTALGVIQTDRKQFGEPARKFMLDVFNLLPADSELIGDYRRKLSMALY